MCFHGLLVTAARYIHAFTETQRVRLCAQLALLAERAPGFYLDFAVHHSVATAIHEQSDFQSHNDGRSLLLGGEEKRDAVTMAGRRCSSPPPVY